MAVTAQQTIFNYVGNGAAVEYTFGCRILDEEDLVVVVDDAVLTLYIDYTVSGVGNPVGGAVTFFVAPAALAEVRLFRQTLLIRQTDYQYGGNFEAAVVNTDLDRLYMAVQDQQSGAAELLNTLRVPAGEVIPRIPAAADRANRVQAYDGAGNPMVIVGVDSGSASALQIALANAFTSTEGDAMVGVNTVGTQTTLHKWVFGRSRSIKSDFGALGDGVTDEGALINDALAAMSAAGGGTMYFPEGDYRHSVPIKSYSNIRLIGANQEATKLTKTGAGTISIGAAANNPMVCLDGGVMSDGAGNVNCSIWLDNAIRCENVEIAHMTIRSTGAAATTAPVRFGIAGIGLSEGYLHDLNIDYFSSASVVLPVFFVSTMHGIRSHRCGQGPSIEAGTSLQIFSNYSRYCQKYGYFLRDISYSSIKNNACDGLNNVSNASDYSDRSIDSRCYMLSALNGCEVSGNGAEQSFGSFIYAYSCINTDIRRNVAYGPASSYTGANHVAIFYVDSLAYGLRIEDNYVSRGAVTAIQGAANAANHHDVYVNVAAANQGFRFLNNWTNNNKYDAPSAIYGNNVPSYLSTLKQGAQLHGDFVPALTLPGATGVTVTHAGDNKGRFSIVNGWMDVAIELVLSNVVFAGTGTITVSGLPFVNGSAKPARLLVDHSSGFAWATTESYFLDIANGAAVGTLKNRTDTVAGVTTSVMSTGSPAYLHIAGRVYVGDVVNVR